MARRADCEGGGAEVGARGWRRLAAVAIGVLALAPGGGEVGRAASVRTRLLQRTRGRTGGGDGKGVRDDLLGAGVPGRHRVPEHAAAEREGVGDSEGRDLPAGIPAAGRGTCGATALHGGRGGGEAG